MKFYADPDDYRTWKTLIAAKYTGLNVQAPRGAGGQGRVLVLETENGCLFNANACARYVARLRPDVGLHGLTFAEEGMVDSWIEWCSEELELPLLAWAQQVKEWPQAAKQAKEDVRQALDILNKHLLKNTYIVGHQITLADICIACALVEGFQFCFDENFRKPYVNVLRWFETCVNQPEFHAVTGQVEFC